MFDFEVIEPSLHDSSKNDEIALEALTVLREQFAEVIGIACALGLVAFEYCLLNVVRRTVNWETIQFVDGKLKWDIDKWKNRLEIHSNLKQSERETLGVGYQRCLEMTKVSSPEDVRWACDGHIGMKLIWAAYARLVNDIASMTPGVKPNPSNQRESVLSGNERIRFNSVARKWAQTSARNNNSPMFCLDLIGAS